MLIGKNFCQQEFCSNYAIHHLVLVFSNIRSDKFYSKSGKVPAIAIIYHSDIIANSYKNPV